MQLHKKDSKEKACLYIYSRQQAVEAGKVWLLGIVKMKRRDT